MAWEKKKKINLKALKFLVVSLFWYSYRNTICLFTPVSYIGIRRFVLVEMYLDVKEKDA